MTRRRSLLWSIAPPILGLLALTPWSAFLDLFVSNFFYYKRQFASSPFLDFIYQYGYMPAWIIAGLAAFALAAACFSSLFRRWRRAAVFLLTTLAIGPGLLVNGVFKDNWGRPRPLQVIEYGGRQPFRAYYEPNLFNQPEPSKSFPSGHASMGFYFFAVAQLGKHYRKRKIYYLGMVVALGLGGLLSLARIAQGGHFLSDTLVSALIVWLTTIGGYLLIFKPYSKVD